MTLPALPVTSSSQPPADTAARGTDAAATTDAPAFSNVLSQQRDNAAAHPAESSRPERADRPGRRADAEPAKSREPLGPDETLSLILDSAALPLMQTPVTEIRPVHAGVTGRTGNADVRAARFAIDAKTAPAVADTHGRPADTPLHSADAPRFTLHQADAAAGLHTARHADVATPATTHQTADVRVAATSQPHHPSNAIQTGKLSQSEQLRAGTQDPLVQSHVRATPLETAQTLVPDAAQASATAPVGATLLTPAATPTPTVLPAVVATPLSHPQWPQDFSRQITQLAQNLTNGGHTVQLHVNPPELGPIHITLHVGDAIAQASFVSPHANVRQTLENALPHLEQQLAEAGLSLGQADVGDQQPGQQAQSQGQPASARNGDTVFSLDGQTADAASVPVTPAMPRTLSRPDALVDTFA